MAARINEPPLNKYEALKHIPLKDTVLFFSQFMPFVYAHMHVHFHS